jgi:NitT/TauT family transport system permease protein
VRRPALVIAALLMAAGLFLPAGSNGWWARPLPGDLAVLTIALVVLQWRRLPDLLDDGLGVLALVIGAAAPLLLLSGGGTFGFTASGLWVLVAGLGLLLWARLAALAEERGRLPAIAAATLFGLAILYLWQVFVTGFGIPQVLLPAPSQVGHVLATRMDVLWPDFEQTFLKSVLIGYALGCGLGFAVAIAIDRSPFLKRGLLPLGNFVSALPMVGVAPIMVMWFGFDWPSKAAVVVVMTFFPMLVNTVAGLNASGQMERDMMRTYAAGYWQTLIKLRLPAAAPFIFNALKINSTLALIGAIVAEFFGTPVVGMGFRISTEVGRMDIDMVWAEIAVAALAGSVFYGIVALIERGVTFWHPSIRGG